MNSNANNEKLVNDVITWALRSPSNQKEELLRELFADKSSSDFKTILNRCHVLNGIYSANNRWIDLTVEYISKATKAASFPALKPVEVVSAFLYAPTYTKKKGKSKGQTCHAHLLSFTTKYLSFLYPEKFHLYDKNVREELVKFGYTKKNQRYKAINSTAKPEAAYRAYSNAIEDFIKDYGLSTYSFKDQNGYIYPNFKAIDMFLWNLEGYLAANAQKPVSYSALLTKI